MIIKCILINGQDRIDDVVDLGGLDMKVSKDFVVETSSVTLVVDDPNRDLFTLVQTAPESAPVIVEIRSEDEGEPTIFLGEIDSATCEWEVRNKNATITASDPFARAKEVELSEGAWKRQAETYAIAEEVAEEDDVWVLDGVEGLWPGDEIEGTLVDGDNNTRTIRATVATVHPEYSSVRVTEGASGTIPVGTSFGRKNHELRFVSMSTALVKIQDDVNGSGLLPVSISAPSGPIELAEPGLYPVPVPQHEQQPGSVVLITTSGNSAVCAYRSRADTPTERGLVEFGINSPSSFNSWTVPGSNSGIYPVDWTRHVLVPPVPLIPPLLGYQVPDYIPRHPLNNSATLGFDSRVYTAIDFASRTGYELREVDPVNQEFELHRWTWSYGGNDWVHDALLRANLIGEVRGLAFDHGAGRPCMLRGPAGNVLVYTFDTGTWSPSPTTPIVQLEDTAHEAFGVLSLDQWMYAGGVGGADLTMINMADWSTQTIAVAGSLIHPHTAIIHQNDLFFVSTGKDGVALHRYALDAGQWVVASTDGLLDYPALSPVTTHTPNVLWVGVNGQMWAWADQYIPMMVRAEVEGMTAGELLQNFLLLSNTYLISDNLGGVSLVPRDTVFEDLGEIQQLQDMVLMSRTDDRYQRVVVNGRGDVEGIATTGIPGDTLEVSCPFIETASHAAAVARLLLDHYKTRRQGLDGTDNELAAAKPLQAAVVEGIQYRLMNVHEPFLRRSTAGKTGLVKRTFQGEEVVV